MPFEMFAIAHHLFLSFFFFIFFSLGLIRLYEVFLVLSR